MVDSNVVDFPERDVDCACRSGRSLEILKVVQRAYEDRLVAIDRAGGARKLQQQVEVLRSWVSDLVAQNTLLTRAVEDLESDATATILERRRHAETEQSKCRCDKMQELKIMQDMLQKDNTAKDREIRRLSQSLQQCEGRVADFKADLACKHRTPTDSPKKHVTVGTDACHEEVLIPIPDYEEMQGEVIKWHHKITKMEGNVKKSSEKIRELLKVNVALHEEIGFQKQLIAVFDKEYGKMVARVRLRDDIIREMKQQLQQLKQKATQHSTAGNASQRDLMSGDHDFSLSPRGPWGRPGASPPAKGPGSPGKLSRIPIKTD